MYVPQRVHTASLGLAAEVFGDGPAPGLPSIEMVYCSDQPGPLATDLGLSFVVEHGLDRLAQSDLVVLLSARQPQEPSVDLAAAVCEAHRRGAIVIGQYLGPYALAATGLLDGLRATTHRTLVDDFATRYPAVDVVPHVLYVDEGQIITGAGADVDVYLHLVRREHGTAAANAIARNVISAPHQDRGRTEFAPAPTVADGEMDRLAEVLEWTATNLHRSPQVSELAGRAFMSPRTFIRRFKAVTGTTPHAWLQRQRQIRSEELLKSTNLSIEEIARRVGYASTAGLREQFVKRHGIPPLAYRRAFAAATAPQRQDLNCLRRVADR
nr:helix-turn-helix domain-containing protein [Plantactinospora endophytica]